MGGQTSDIQRFDPATGQTLVIGHLPVTLGHAALSRSVTSSSSSRPHRHLALRRDLADRHQNGPCRADRHVSLSGGATPEP